MEVQYRISRGKEDALKIADKIDEYCCDISPYSKEELRDVIHAGARGNEIEKVKRGRSYALCSVDKWFKKRVKPNTVTIDKKMYKRALYCAFRLILLGDIAKTDFGSARQRDFGQRLTDFTRGFLGEIVLESFFLKRYGKKILLEEKKIGDVEDFLSTDIVKVYDKKINRWREPRLSLSIKTSKLPSLWLDIPEGQLNHSDIFCFIKIGLTVDHFAVFLKETDLLRKFVEVGKEVDEVENAEEELRELIEAVPDMTSWPAYIAGFLWDRDFLNGKLKIDKKRKNRVVEGGCGYYGGDEADKFIGLGDISGGKYLSCTGELHFEENKWRKLISRI